MGLLLPPSFLVVFVLISGLWGDRERERDGWVGGADAKVPPPIPYQVPPACLLPADDAVALIFMTYYHVFMHIRKKFVWAACLLWGSSLVRCGAYLNNGFYSSSQAVKGRCGACVLSPFLSSFDQTFCGVRDVDDFMVFRVFRVGGVAVVPE